MINKATITSRVDNITRILHEHNLADTISAESNRISADINDYAYRVLMIGGFSSGKSAFLNTLIGRDVLKENQAPETTIATELIYDSNEYIEAITDKGEIIRFGLGAIPPSPNPDWRYLVYHVDCPFLKEHPDIILVDMPGLDSNIECHNKAISQYISKGSAYILLVSCEDGTLKKSTVDFLSEITQYPQSLCCFVSKADLKLPSDVNQICAQVESEIAGIYGSAVPVSPISVFYEGFENRVLEKISCFDPQYLFERKFAGEINALISLSRSVLQTAKDALVLDVSAIDRKISELKSNRKEITRKFEREKQQIERKYSNQVIPAILMDLENALISKVDQLTAAIMVSPDAFNAAVNSVIRPVLYASIEQHIENSFEEFVDQLDLSFMSENNEELKAAIIDGLKLIGSYIEQVNDKKDDEQSKNARHAFQGILATAAIATNVVSPVIELIIVLLPSILSLFSGMSRNAKIDELKQKIQMVVIPEIVEKLSPKITSVVCETRDAMIEESQRKVLEITSAQEETLKKCLLEKKELNENYSTEQEQFSRNISLLETLRI